MAMNQSELLGEVRADFEALLNLVTWAEAQTATVNQMERSLLRQLLAMGRKLLQVFLAYRAETESHAPQYGWQRQKFLYHSQKAVDYLSVFGKLEVSRAYFYAPGAGGKTPLDRALSLPERCYSDLLMECAALLAVDSAYDKATKV